MPVIEIELPDVATWNKTVFDAAGIPPKTLYSTVRFRKNAKVITQSVSEDGETLRKRLMSIKTKSGPTDRQINKLLSGYITCTMIANIHDPEELAAP